MEVKKIIKIFNALANENRFEIFRLINSSKDGICPCIISAKLEIPRNTISFHLSALVNAGLILSTKKGKYINYSKNDIILELLKDSIFTSENNIFNVDDYKHICRDKGEKCLNS